MYINELSCYRGSATTSDDDKKEKTEPLKKVHNRSVPRERLSRDRSRESDRSSLGLTRLYLPRDHSCERNHLYQVGGADLLMLEDMLQWFFSPRKLPLVIGVFLT